MLHGPADMANGRHHLRQKMPFVPPWVLGKTSVETPEIAANIGVQMGHMGLDVPTVSVVRRLRDIVVTLQPRRVAEVGAAIGHTTAWFLDAWSRDNVVAPDLFDVMEEGNRFAVILDRVLNATGWRMPDEWSWGRSTNMRRKPAHGGWLIWPAKSAHRP